MNKVILVFLSVFLAMQLLAQEGTQRLVFSDINRRVDISDMKQVPYFLSGKKMYEIGMMDGSFPERKDKAEERGVWIHPVKLLSGFGFSILEDGQNEWTLVDAQDFEFDFYSARFSFSKNGFSVVREDFVGEDDKALYVRLKIKNDLFEDRSFQLKFWGKVDIRPSWRTETLQDSKDSICYKDGKIVAFDSSGFFMMGSLMSPSGYFVNQDVVTLDYDFSLSAGESLEIPFLIAGENAVALVPFDEFEKRCENLIGRYAEEKEKKKREYIRSITENVRFDCSRKDITDAFYCAKANILMNIKDERPFYPDLFIGAGVPVYPRLFGTDFCFSLSGCLSGGFDDIARKTLKNLLYYAAKNLRAPHEVSSDGILLGWDHIQVSPQLVNAVWEYFLWTRDTLFLAEAYPLCKRMMQDILENMDETKKLYISGHGLMEESEFQSNWVELTTAAYTFSAFCSLSEMAGVMQENSVSEHYSVLASEYQKRFNADWWDDAYAIWPSAMNDKGEKVYSCFWNVVFPQKTELANGLRGQRAFSSIKKYWVNDTWGMIGKYNEGMDISHEGVGVVHNNICAMAAFLYGDVELGWKLIQLSAKAPLLLKNSPLGLFPECQPQGCSNISQLWSYATFLESTVKGLAGIRPCLSDNSVEIYLHVPDDLDYVSVEDFKIGNDLYSLNWEKTKEGNLSVRISGKGENKKIKVRINSSFPYRISLNGLKKSGWKKEIYNGVETKCCMVYLP